MGHRSRDYDDTTRWSAEWWNTLEKLGPEPYSTATWAYVQEVVEEDDVDG